VRLRGARTVRAAGEEAVYVPDAPRAPIASHRPDPAPGLAAAAIVLAIYGGLGLAVNFPRVAFGFQSDEATYYMMGHSLARDADLTYRREDLVRVWREFPGGPSGLFLKRGQDVQGIGLAPAPPFFAIEGAPDPDTRRLFYGKSFAYPLAAAPLVLLFGTNGFLVLHAILLSLMVLAGYLFLNARSSAGVALLLSAGFVMASVAPAYFVWITPEIFNLTLVTLGYFCWLYKEVAPPDPPRGLAWLLGPSSDLAAAALLAVATFSKPSNILLIGPIVVWQLARGRAWRRALATLVLFGSIVAVFFAANIAITGDWNFQGGDRRTFNGGYPFQTESAGFEVGLDRTTNEILTDIIFGPNSWTVFRHNLAYFFIGRYSGLVPYFFPAVFALAAFALARGRRAAWQYLVLAVALVEILLLIVWIPYNYFGGGGVLGNRYFMNVYGLFLFLLPPIGSMAAALAPWLVGGLFTAQITLNPFYSSFHPAYHAKWGPARILPVELSLFNDLPIMTEHARVRLPFGTEPRFQITFLDENAYIEDNAFWVKGESTADLLVRYQAPAKRLYLTLTAGEADTTVRIETGGEMRERHVPAGQSRQVTIQLDEGFPYLHSRIWPVSIASSAGFTPLFGATGSTDNRYLGIRVTPELVP
jgi:hypothetical protein